MKRSCDSLQRFGSRVLLGCCLLGGSASSAAEDVPAAATEHATVDAVQDVSVEAAPGTTPGVAREAAIDAPAQPPVEAAAPMPAEAAAPATVDAAQEVPLDATGQNSNDAAPQAPLEAAAQTPAQATQKTPTAAAPETVIDAAQDVAGEDAQPDTAAEPANPIEQRYLDAVSTVESAGGAYDPALSQYLLGLGIAYQNDGKHAEAAEVLNRAAHVTRVNEGLYSTADLPILELLIESYAALGEWEEVGNRYHQMFQIHHRNYGNNDPRLLPMLDKLSAWHMRAYLQDLGEQPLNHLITARNLNDSSTTIMRANYPANDPRIADSLRQRALADYYLASYRPPDIPETGFDTADDAAFTRQPSYLINSFSDGRDALSSAVEIRRQDPDSTSLQRSQAVAELGDWHQLFNRTQTALDTYREAYAEGMQGGDDPASVIDQVFGKPQALPLLPQDYTLPVNPATRPQAYILLSFAVNEKGQADDFQVLESVPAAADKSVTKLQRQLRATRFRPRFADGEPAATSGLTYRYFYQP